MKPSKLVCFKDTINFVALLFFSAASNTKVQWANARAWSYQKKMMPKTKSRAQKKESCQKQKVVPKKESRANKKKSCQTKRVVPEKTDVAEKKLDKKN